MGGTDAGGADSVVSRAVAEQCGSQPWSVSADDGVTVAVSVSLPRVPGGTVPVTV
jgi:hypothetical protein